MKIKGFIISSVLTFIFVVGLSSCKFSLGSMDEIKYKDSEKYTVGEGSVASASRLEIDWICGDVKIVRGEGQAISFLEESEGELKEKHRLHWYLDGEILRLKCAENGTRALNFPEKALTVAVPEGARLDIVEISSVSADIRIEEQIIDNLYLETVSGNAEVGGEISGTLDVNTVSGNLAIALDGRNDKVDLEGVSGDVSLVGEAKNIFLESVSGTLALLLSECPEIFECESVSGNISIKVPEESGFSLEFETTSGELISEIPTRKVGKNYVAGDGTFSFEVETVSGNLRITARD